MSDVTLNTERTAYFGAQEVPEHQKADLVGGMFGRVARSYDLMNDLASLGIHRVWKHQLLARLAPEPSMALLDVGGGTGDIAFGFVARGGGAVTVCDINPAMLDVGREREAKRPLAQTVEWVEGDAEALPFADHSFDAYVTAFCIRNVTHIDAALAEARRVLRPGGRFLCLEFSHPQHPTLRSAFNAYASRVLPVLGKAVANEADAYRYLAESIQRFPDQKRFSKLIADAGLERVTHQDLSGGIAAIHSAIAPR